MKEDVCKDRICRQYTVGIDEVGRGPLAGPVTVCAVLWIGEEEPHTIFEGIRDSKKLSEKQRLAWLARAEGMRGTKIQYAVRSVSASVIDREGIISALAYAASGALHALDKIVHVYADYGLPVPDTVPVTHLVKGDEKHPLIALASIIAKVTRDKKMSAASERYGAYGFERNKGYGTKEHREALRLHGLTPLHRKTFLRNIVYAPQGV